MPISCFLVSKQERSCIRNPGEYIFMFYNLLSGDFNQLQMKKISHYYRFYSICVF